MTIDRQCIHNDHKIIEPVELRTKKKKGGGQKKDQATCKYTS